MHPAWQNPANSADPGIKGVAAGDGRRAGFTLLELCLAIFIAVIIMLAAVPSIQGVVEEQRARKLFTQFDSLATRRPARGRSRSAALMSWSGTTMG